MFGKSRFSSAVALPLAVAVLIASCASSTVIDSVPGGAKVYINESYAGTTPYKHTDKRIVGSTLDVRLEMNGFEPLSTTITKNEEVDVGAVIGGFLLVVPFAWVMKYQPEHVYELVPRGTSSPGTVKARLSGKASKADKLRELKQLLDDKVITQEDYDAEKKRILESND
jgi:hypothetical protein